MNKLSLTDFVKQEENKRKFSRCRVCKLPEKILNEVNEALTCKSMPQAVISRWLGTLGYNIAKPSLTLHYDHTTKNKSQNISQTRAKRTKSS